MKINRVKILHSWLFLIFIQIAIRNINIDKMDSFRWDLAHSSSAFDRCFVPIHVSQPHQTLIVLVDNPLEHCISWLNKSGKIWRACVVHQSAALSIKIFGGQRCTFSEALSTKNNQLRRCPSKSIKLRRCPPKQDLVYFQHRWIEICKIWKNIDKSSSKIRSIWYTNRICKFLDSNF